MEDSWHTIFTSWCRYLVPLLLPDEYESSVDIELNTTCKARKVVDFRMASAESFNDPKSSTASDRQPLSSDLIHLEIHFGDEICSKSLNYGTFSRWGAIEGLLMDMKDDGMILEELWDVNERMNICSGDWDARVRPGWDIQAHCRDRPSMLETLYLEDDSDSDYSESEEERWIDAILEPYQEEWCLPRWREKVELDKSNTVTGQAEPSWTVLAVGCTWVLLFIIVAVVYTV